MSRLSALLLILFSLNASVVPCAAQARSEGHRVVTKTRLQVVFSNLETRWLTAIQKKDSSALDQLLGENFEVWTPAQNEPIPLEEWKQQAFSRTLRSFQIRQLAVRAVSEDASIASFVLSQEIKNAGNPRTEDAFVVDVWIKEGESWRCSDRYVSTVPSSKSVAEDTKPTGRK